jgi:AcrR family transcriptional regulator
MASNPSSAAPPAADRRPVRERLLAAADELFYREGINNVGIDRVLAHAGVAKASLYSTFGSKDELVRAYLQGRQQTRRARVEARLAGHADPREQLLAVFDAMADTLAQPGFRGCAFVMASAERAGGDRGRPVCDDYRQWIRELFARLAQETGAGDPALLARQLLLLYDGALIEAQMDGTESAVVAAQAARATAAALIDAAVAGPVSAGADRVRRAGRPPAG